MKHFLHNDARLAVALAGILLLCSALITLRMRTKTILESA